MERRTRREAGRALRERMFGGSTISRDCVVSKEVGDVYGCRLQEESKGSAREAAVLRVASFGRGVADIVNAVSLAFASTLQTLPLVVQRPRRNRDEGVTRQRRSWMPAS